MWEIVFWRKGLLFEAWKVARRGGTHSCEGRFPSSRSSPLATQLFCVVVSGYVLTGRWMWDFWMTDGKAARGAGLFPGSENFFENFATFGVSGVFI